MLTPAEIAAMAERCEAAVKPPWKWCGQRWLLSEQKWQETGDVRTDVLEADTESSGGYGGGEYAVLRCDEPTRAFIAASRADVDALLADRAELVALLKEARVWVGDNPKYRVPAECDVARRIDAAIGGE